MDPSAGSRTSPTLIGRLGTDPADQAAWVEFVRRYGPRILGWCRRWNLQDADAEDVTQSVLLRLAGKLRTFRYDPDKSFRAWLRTLTHHALSDFLDGCRRAPGGRAELADRLESVPARGAGRPCAGPSAPRPRLACPRGGRSPRPPPAGSCGG